MRISVDNLNVKALPLTCFVDGQPVDRCVEADTVEGWARVLAADAQGSLIQECGGQVRETVLRGDVRIRWDRIAPNWRPE